ncbi:HD domain protein [uncultured archaeon]|nr:HD domain protein [uncultured archaeon]
MSKLESAELFAKARHSGMTIDDKTPYWKHLEGVVNRLKNLGITDEDLLCVAWLHDSIENTVTTFDDIEQRFGSKVAVMVLALSKDKNVSTRKQEQQYIKQLKDASWEVKLVKLCDISANLKDLKNIPWSKTKKSKEIKKKLYYLNLIKPELIKIKFQIPGIQGIISGINEVLASYNQRPVVL